MFSLRLFRFRSLERNRESDERRIAFIQKVVRSAVAEAEAEATGLRARMTKARRSVIFLVEHGESGGPDPSHHAELTSLEARLLVGEQKALAIEISRRVSSKHRSRGDSSASLKRSADCVAHWG
jgi:hypothetical protein